MMEKESQMKVGLGKGLLWLIHHMITDDHPWSSPIIFQIENHRLVERLRWLKLTLRLSPVFRSIFSRRMSISWWALSSSSWVFSWAIWYLPAAPWVAWNVEKKRKQCLLRFHLHPLKFFSELVHLASVLVPLRVAARQGLLDLVKLLLNKRHYCAHSLEFGVLTELYLNILIFRLRVLKLGAKSVDLALRFLNLEKGRYTISVNLITEIEGYWCCWWSELTKVFTVHPWS